MRRSVLLTAAAGALLASVGLAGCATQYQNADQAAPGAPAEPDGTAPVPLPTDPGPYRASGIVLESPEHGPMLCMFVATSYPPQCGNLELVGWDWDLVDGEESANGTTWGGPYEVTGTWDGERLTLTEPPRMAEPTVVTPDSDFSTPCPEPAGGWGVIDPATTTSETLEDAIAAARARPDFAGVWLDQPIREPAPGAPDNDPTNLVLNVRVTGDVAQAEQDLRQIWGGALCVSSAGRSQAELSTIQEEISADSAAIKMLYSSIDETTGLVTVGVVIDDGSLQAHYDERYGPGVVSVTSWLQPV
jgi:hypothetical protein